MANSPFDKPRATRFSQSLNHLCQWRKCEMPAHPDVPVPMSLCKNHWVEIGKAYESFSVTEVGMEWMRQNRRRDVRYRAPAPQREHSRCPACNSEIVIDNEDLSVLCLAKGCGYRSGAESYKATMDAKYRQAGVEWRQQWLVNHEQARVARQHMPLVYYISFGDRIKIGTTIDMARRMGSLPHDEIMAVEPGSFDVESQRHAQFAKHRISGEWFESDPELLKHIDWISTIYPIEEYAPRRHRKAA